MSDTFFPGSQIDRFVVEAEVGRGGMGLVYRCYDPDHDRQVALKVMATHLANNTEALARFRREAALVSSLKHPHIAVFYEFGEVAARPYLVMEWVNGHTLKDELTIHKKLPQARCLALFAQLAKAVDYAHTRGVIHRDLKPANIIIGPDDAATIVDFGVALLDAAPSLTATGLIVGTPLYMSPEQIKGQELDGRSDQYSLAIILYEMLTGQFPYESIHVPAIYHQQLLGQPTPITEKDPTLSASIDRALQKALAKEPGARFATVEAFDEALRLPVVETPPNGRFLHPKPRWQHQVAGTITAVFRLETDQLLLALADGSVKLLHGESAEILWQAEAEGRVMGMVNEGDYLYGNTDTGAVIAWQRSSGKERWRHLKEGVGTLHLLNEQTLLLVMDKGIVCYLAARDGAEIKRVLVSSANGAVLDSFMVDDQLFLVTEHALLTYGLLSEEEADA